MRSGVKNSIKLVPLIGILQRFHPPVSRGAGRQGTALSVLFYQFLLITQACRTAGLRQKLIALGKVLILLRESVEVLRAHEAALAG